MVQSRLWSASPWRGSDPAPGAPLCRMTIHVKTSDLPTVSVELREVLGTLGLTHIARWFNVNQRSVRRWRDRSRRVPRGAAILFNLMAAQVVTADQIEQAAVAISAAQMNGDGKFEPPAPRPVEPAPETPTDPSLAIKTTVAAKVYRLVVGTCRWPTGDPRHRDFSFCGRPAVKGSYCEEHCAMAHIAPPIGNGHSATAPAHAARLARQSVLRRLLHV